MRPPKTSGVPTKIPQAISSGGMVAGGVKRATVRVAAGGVAAAGWLAVVLACGCAGGRE
jgi:hypothetical protein